MMRKFSVLLALSACTPPAGNVALTIMKPEGGTVRGVGIDCGNDCDESFALNAQVTLQAIPDPGYVVEEWHDGCANAEDSTICLLSMDEDKTVEAHFSPMAFTVSVVADEGGSVADLNGAISCTVEGEDTCYAEAGYHELITFTATAQPGFAFAGWGGNVSCPGVGPCEVIVTQNVNVIAHFVQEHTLTLGVGGVGAGEIGASGLTGCTSGDCTYPVIHGTVLQLTATPAPGLFFNGWTGACTGFGECTVTLESDTAVNASFVPLLLVHSSGISEIASVHGDGTALTYPGPTGYWPHWLADGVHLLVQDDAVVCENDENSAVLAVDFSGSAQCLTDVSGLYSLSPLRDRFAFPSSRDPQTGGLGTTKYLYTMAVDGTDRQLVAAVTGSVNVWSWVGDKITYEASSAMGNDVFVVTLPTGEPVNITESTADASYLGALSPDGASVAFSRANALWIADADGGNLRELAPASPLFSCLPVWTPDGAAIIGSWRAPSPDNFTDHPSNPLNIFRVPLDGGPITGITATSGAGTSYSCPGLTPDNQGVYFLGQDGALLSIWASDFEGGDLRAVVAPTNASFYTPSSL